jgi:thiamine-phosphate pyrophosphorylase
VKPLEQCLLYAFVDTAYLHGRTPGAVTQALCDGGADLIQLRAKKSTPAEIRLMAQAILPITRRADVGLVINDHLDIAQEIGAEICHLGQEDFFDIGCTHVSRRRTPHSLARQSEAAAGALHIGLSTHSPAQAERALAAEPDYIAIGPIYATGTKPTAKPVTLDYVRWAAANVRIPWFAIGGINLETLDDVLAAGAGRVCIVSAILNSPDIAVACRTFKARLESWPAVPLRII